MIELRVGHPLCCQTHWDNMPPLDPGSALVPGDLVAVRADSLFQQFAGDPH
jgi:hypothetical protein